MLITVSSLRYAEAVLKATSKEERMSKENMALWNSVCETDPGNTKHVNQRGGFTAIGAQSQLMKATEVFGAFGYGWGVKTEHIDKWEDCGLVIYQATLWFLLEGKDEECYVPIHSSIQYNKNGRIDDDFFKKVATDALTKGLSKLGFNADVFMGKFDDNKYVNTLTEKYTKQMDDTAKELVKKELKGIQETDDFYVKVIHALDKGKIGNGNLESSIQKIKDYKSSIAAKPQPAGKPAGKPKKQTEIRITDTEESSKNVTN